MSSIFISHSSKDNSFAEHLKNQLEEHGHQSIFLDFDPEQGISAGTNWEQILYAKLRACQAVIILCSQHSMSSKWVFAEITHARSEGKHIFPLKISECKPVSILNDTQIIDFTTEQDLERLWQGIDAANLDSEFAWDSSRDPYPGLTTFEEADAAVFFGRKTEIQEGIEQLNSLRQNSDRRLVLYLGASGSGKSSLVRAGIIPRLKRDSSRWLVIDPFRPNARLADPMDNLAAVFWDAFKKVDNPYSKEEIRQKLLENTSDRSHGLLQIAQSIADESDLQEATVLIVIDQFEELLIRNSTTNQQETNLESQKKFLAWLGETLTAAEKLPSCPVMVLATMRSDFLVEYQTCAELHDVKTLQVSVKPIPKANFGELIEAPAQKAGIKLESGLVPKILEDVEAENTLPLLAYTLHELWKGYGDDYKLELAEYKQLGGVKGSIAKKANEVLQNNNINQKEIEEHLKRAFLKLVQVSETGKYVRKRAKKSELPSHALPFLNELVKNRLLNVDINSLEKKSVTKSEDSESQDVVYEVTHEVIFSAWKSLDTWLKENEKFLRWRKSFEERYKNYVAGKRDNGLLLSGTFLSQSLDWHSHLGEQERDEKEFIRLSQKRQKRREIFLRLISILAGSFAIAVLFFWLDSEMKREEAELEIRATNLKVKLALSNKVDYLLESIALTGDNQNFNQKWSWFPKRWKVSKINPMTNIQSVLYQALESSRERNSFDHKDVVILVAFYKNGRFKVSASQDGEIKLWDVEKQELINNPIQNFSEISSLAISNDGEYLVVGDKKGTLFLWDIKNNEQIISLKGKSQIRSVSISEDKKYIVSGNKDGIVTLLTKEEDEPGKCLHYNSDSISCMHKYSIKNITDISEESWNKNDQDRCFTDKSVINSIVISSHNQYIVSGSENGITKLWDIKRNKLSNCFQDTSSVKSVAISRDNRDKQYVVTGNQGKEIKLWDLNNNQFPSYILQGHRDEITSVAFSKDSEYIVSGSLDHTAKLWSVSNEKLLQTFHGHKGRVFSVAFSPNGKYIVSGSNDKTVKLWDVKENQFLKGIFNGNRYRVYSANFSPDSQYLVSGSNDKNIKLWDIREKSLFHKSDNQDITHRNQVNQKYRDEDCISKKNNDESHQNIASNTSNKNKSLLGKFIDPNNKTNNAHEKCIYSVVVSPNGNYIASSGRDKNIKLWSMENKALLGELIDPNNKNNKAHQDWVYQVVFSPTNSDYIASSSKDKSIKLWSIKDKKLVGEFINPKNKDNKAHKHEVSSIDFSNDGKYLLSGSWDNTVKLWDVESRSLVDTFTTNSNMNSTIEDRIHTVAFHPDEKHFASGSWDSTIKLWNKNNNTIPIHIFDGHKERVYSLDFSNDGKYLLSGSWDNTIKLWDVDNKSLIYTINAHQDGVHSVSFSPDENYKYFASGSWDSTVKLWQTTDWKDWLKLGCKQLRLHPILIKDEIEAYENVVNTCIKNKKWSNTEEAEFLVKQGLYIAKKPGNVLKALSLYREAQKIDPNLKIEAKSWNSLCWHGSINEQAKDVLFACDRAVDEAPTKATKANYQDGRGLARALTANTPEEIRAAIDDFEFFIKHSAASEEDKKERREWIESLQNGDQPFTKEVLER